VLFHDFYVHIVFMCCIVLNLVGLYLFFSVSLLAFQATVLIKLELS